MRVQARGYLGIEPFVDFTTDLAVEIQFVESPRGLDGVNIELSPAQARVFGQALIYYAEHIIDPLDSDKRHEVERQIEAILNAD